MNLKKLQNFIGKVLLEIKESVAVGKTSFLGSGTEDIKSDSVGFGLRA